MGQACTDIYRSLSGEIWGKETEVSLYLESSSYYSVHGYVRMWLSRTAEKPAKKIRKVPRSPAPPRLAVTRYAKVKFAALLKVPLFASWHIRLPSSLLVKKGCKPLGKR